MVQGDGSGGSDGLHLRYGRASLPRVHRAGREVDQRWEISAPMTVACFEINYWARGGSEASLNGEPQRLEHHHAYLYRPGEAFAWVRHDAGGNDLRWVNFHWPTPAGWGDDVALRRSLPLHGACERAFVGILDELIASAHEAGSELACAALLLQLMALWRREQEGPRHADCPGVRRALSFMREHHARALTLGEIARASGFCEDYFKRRFRRLIGEPPFQWLLRLRLEEARSLLARERGLSIERAALRCGFGDPKHFSRSFRRRFGLCPRQFRSHHSGR